MTFLNGPGLTESKLNTIQGEDHLGIKNVAVIIERNTKGSYDNFFSEQLIRKTYEDITIYAHTIRIELNH